MWQNKPWGKKHPVTLCQENTRTHPERRLPMVSCAARRTCCAQVGQVAEPFYANLAFLGKEKKKKGARDTKIEDTTSKGLIIFHCQKRSTLSKRN